MQENTKQSVPGEQLLFSLLSSLPQTDEHLTLPTDLNEEMKELARLLLETNPQTLAKDMFADPDTAYDLTDLAIWNGENRNTFYKSYPGGESDPLELRNGFILTLLRSLKQSSTEMYLRDQDLNPQIELFIFASVLESERKSVKLVLRTPHRRDEKTFSY